VGRTEAEAVENWEEDGLFQTSLASFSLHSSQVMMSKREKEIRKFQQKMEQMEQRLGIMSAPGDATGRGEAKAFNVFVCEGWWLKKEEVKKVIKKVAV
jgi:hypothetical protein